MLGGDEFVQQDDAIRAKGGAADSKEKFYCADEPLDDAYQDG
jgi:hypothetical protein